MIIECNINNICFDWTIPLDVRKPDDKRVSVNIFEFLSVDYSLLYYITKKLNVRSLIEIGVRAGYSMYAFLSANPELRYLGIDNDSNSHGGNKSYINYAINLSKRFKNATKTFIIASSHDIKSISDSYDMSYVDGDHSYEGCLMDLELIMKCSRYILVDDYDYIDTVKMAIDEFYNKNKMYDMVRFNTRRGHVLFLP